MYPLVLLESYAMRCTMTRYESVACDEGRFISPGERALVPLTLVFPKSAILSSLYVNDNLLATSG